ncbi:MAG: HYR domain-containing protein [Nocardioides sp.]|nr:HYR domain-containing protein [Nocardioides sp.]
MSISQASRRTVAVLASLSTAVVLVVVGTIPTTTYAAAPAGTVVAWGQNDNGQVTVPPTLAGDVVAVAGGGVHSLALRTDGTVAAWGSNSRGQTTVPAGLTDVTAIAAGSLHNLALRSDGTVVGWGWNEYGQRTPPAGLGDATAIAAGDVHSLVLRSNGTVLAFGYNGDGQLNVPSGLTGVVAISAGGAHSLALRSDGTVVGWGANWAGQGSAPAGLSGVTAIAAGAYHNLALKTGGTVVAWGSGGYGQTVVPAGLTDVVAVSAGAFFSLALKADGTVVAWGNNSHGESTLPAGLSGVSRISAGFWHGLALVVPPDTSPPVLDLPADIAVDATGSTGAVVAYTVSATDDTDPSPTVVCVPASGSTFPIGTTPVDCTATDDAGNSDTGSFDVTVAPVTVGLSLEKSVDLAQARPGDLVTYTLQVRNTGPGVARDVIVTDPVPPGTSLASVNVYGGTCGLTTPNTITCMLGTITPGGTKRVTFQVTVDPIADDPDHTGNHRLSVAKVEAHLSLPATTTSSATGACPTGYLATDGSVRLDAVDQGAGTYADAVVLANGVTADGTGWTGTIHNRTTGQVQAKVTLVCVSERSTSGDDHHHALITSDQVTSTHAWGPGTWDVGLTCGSDSVPVAPSYRFTSGEGVVRGSWRSGPGYRFTVEVPTSAQAVFGITCLSRSLQVTAGHTHDLGLSTLTDELTVPAGETVERSLTCAVGAKGITAAYRFESGLVFLGSDPRPLTRAFRFANPSPAPGPLTASIGLLCLDGATGGEHVVNNVTNTAWVSTSSPDATSADDTDTATFRATPAAGVITIGSMGRVVTTGRGTLVKVGVTARTPRQVHARLVAIRDVHGTDLTKGDPLARVHVRLARGRSTLTLMSVSGAARPLTHGQVPRAKLVITLRDGTRLTKVVTLRAR